MRKQESQFIRQGDVLFKKIESIDSHAIPLDHKTVALGEQTGHHHSFNSGQVTLFRTPEMEEPKYIQVGSQGAVLEHQEHLSIQVPEGTYEVIKEQEYDPWLKNIQQVRD